MNLILPPSVQRANNQRATYERFAQRIGFVPLKELRGAEPHAREAKQLDLALRGMDHRLELGYLFDPWDPRKNRWAIRRWTEANSTELVRIIEDADKKYAPPSMEVILDLQRNNLQGKRGQKWALEALHQEDDAEEREAKRKAQTREEIREVADKHLRDIRFKGKQGQRVF